MFEVLWKKMVTSRKFVVLVTTAILKLVAPLASNYGVDLTFVSQALDEWLPVIIAWLIGQSAVDVAKEVKLPPPPDDALGVPQ